MAKLSIDELWKTCSAERRAMIEAMVPDLVTAEDATADEIIRVIAAANHARPESFIKYPLKQQVAFTSKVIDSPGLVAAREWAIRSWLLKHHRNLLCAMCDACKLPHEDGMIGPEVPAPSLADARDAAKAVLNSNQERPTAVYFGFLVAADMTGFGDFSRVLEEAGIDLRALLAKPVSA